MGFWLYMLGVTMLIPAMMIFFGIRFRRSAPKKINRFFGFRTGRSMSSQDAWDFAHRHLGRLWPPVGWVTLVCSAAAMLPAMDWEEELLSMYAIAITLVQLAALILSAILTQRELLRRFDKNGNPR